MNKLHKSILIALVLGDGYLNVRKDARYPNSYHSSINFTHSFAQKEYLEWKANKLFHIFGGKQPVIREINNNGHPGVTFEKSNKYFRILKKYLYVNQKKSFRRDILNWLTPEGIAIWWMDDGSLIERKRNGKTHAWELYLNTYLTDEENQIIIDYFLEQWNVKWNINHDKGKSRLRCSTREGRKFLNIVRPTVEKIECMKYKVKNIWHEYPTPKGEDIVWTIENK